MFKTMYQMYRLIKQKKRLGWLMVSTIIVAILTTFSGYLYTPLINQFVKRNELMDALFLMLVILVINIMIWLLTFFNKKYSLLGQKDEEAHHVQVIIEGMKSRDQLAFKKLQSGGWLTLLTDDVAKLSSFGFTTILNFVGGGLTFIGALVFGFITSPLLTLTILSLSFFAVFIPKKLSQYIENHQSVQQQSNEHLQVAIIQLVRERLLLRIYRTKNFAIEFFNREYHHYNENELKTKHYSVLMMATSIMSGFVFTVVWVSVALILIQLNQLTIGNFVTFTVLNNSFAWCFFVLPSIYNELLMQKVSFERLQNIGISKAVNENDVEINRLVETLMFKDVSYQYPEQSQTVLEDVNLEIDLKNHDKIALVGASGSGKSTLCQLILGNYEISSGAVLLDNNMIDYSEALNQFVSFMPQSNIIFSSTLRDNILLGEEVASDKLEGILKISGVDEIVASLPQGLDTYLTTNHLILSEGERQRVCFARMLTKEAPLYILDEPTASLDKMNEERILSYLLNMEAAFVLVTHRSNQLSDKLRVLTIDRKEIKNKTTL